MAEIPLRTGKDMALLSSFISEAVAHGLEIEPEEVSHDRQYPTVLSFRGSGKSGLSSGYILLYPDSDIYMTSTQISMVVKYVQLANEHAGEVLLVFAEDMLSRVFNVLSTAGIPKHTMICTYKIQDNKCIVSWP